MLLCNLDTIEKFPRKILSPFSIYHTPLATYKNRDAHVNKLPRYLTYFTPRETQGLPILCKASRVGVIVKY